MSTPFYVSPEQLMQDRADFAQKGIARGRSVVALQYADGILLVAENPSQALHKISEIYDRIAFAAVGRYNEFENLRIAGVRLADMRGYAYDRRDVTGRGLANAYAQTLGTIFSSGGEKPYEVEIFVAEVGKVAEEDQIFRLTYQGQVADEHGYAVMGGQAEAAAAYLKEHYEPGRSLDQALHVAVAALGHTTDDRGQATDRVLPVLDLEVAVLDRNGSRPRKFDRLRGERLESMLGDRGPEESPPSEADDTDQVTGETPPAEQPVTGEPNQPPVAPPSRPGGSRPPAPAPDPSAPGEARPPAPQPEPIDPARPPRPADPAPPVDPTKPTDPSGPSPQPGGPGEI